MFRIWFKGFNQPSQEYNLHEVYIKAKEAMDAGLSIVYIEDLDMRPGVDKFIQALWKGLYIEVDTPTGDRVTLSFKDGTYYIDGKESTVLDTRRSIQYHYIDKMDDWEEDLAYIEQYLYTMSTI